MLDVARNIGRNMGRLGVVLRGRRAPMLDVPRNMARNMGSLEFDLAADG
jgi:hypothetical protein